MHTTRIPRLGERARLDLGQVKQVVCVENVRSKCSLRPPQQTVPLQRFCPIDRLAPCTLPELF
jgi:hypothetical protein